MKKILLLLAAFLMVAITKAQDADIIFEQSEGAGGDGIVSDYYVPVESGAYSADDFTIAAETEIGSFKFQGFGGDPGIGLEPVLAGFHLYVYADIGGAPAGYPGGPVAAVFELEALWDAINGPEDGLSYEKVETEGAMPTYIVTMDVQEATGNVLTLGAGSYWVVIAGIIDADPDSEPSPPRFNWTASDDMSGGLPKISDPQSLFGLSSAWSDLNVVTEGTDFNALTFTVYGPSVADGGNGDDCAQGNDSNNFEGGMQIGTGTDFENADDFLVSAGNTMNIQTISLNVLAAAPINQIDLIFYADNNGAPGAVLPQSVTNAPDADHQVLIGEAFGFNVYQIYVDVNLDFEGGTAGASYWMQPLAAAAGGANGGVFWEVTLIGSIGEAIHGRGEEGQPGGPWGADENGSQGVFKFYCEQTDPPEAPILPCNFDITTDIEPITRVVFSDIDNSSSATIDGSLALEDFTSIEGHIQQGVAYDIAIEGNTNGNYNNYITAFIDYSGVDEGEWSDFDIFEIGSIANSTGMDGQQATGTITLDASVPNGTYTMRIIKSYGSSSADSPINPCISYSYGQAEDYTLIVSGEATLDCPDLGLNIGDACDDGDDTTENDVVTGTCDCVGTPILAEDQCGFENFNNSNIDPTSTSYVDGSFVGNNGVTWTYVAARDEVGDANESGINGKAMMLRRASSDSKVTSSAVSGGISDFSVKLYKGFTGGGDRQVELFVNGVSHGLSDAFDDLNEHVFTVTGINISGDVVIEIRNSTEKQVIIDDISWTCGSDVVWDCPDLEKNIGDTCDDGDSTTENDVIIEGCECVGTSIEEPGDSYCEGEGVVFSDEGGIKNFKTVNGITNINNQDIANPTGYHDFTDMNVSIVAGGAFVLIADIDPVGEFGDAGIAVYIDYNNNFEFELNPSELVYTTISFVTTITVSVTIPEDTDPGNYRLRIVSDWGSLTPNPCTAKSSIHDYTVMVTGVVYDCPDLQANIGDACDDGDPTTENDVITGSCECAGTPFSYDCPDLEATIGDSCENADGEAGVIDEDCNCYVAPTYDCPELEANIGDGCENADGEEGVIDEDCNCYVASTYDCPELEANVGDECSIDGAEDNGLVNADCECIVVGIYDVAGFNFKMYPNPAGSNESVTLTSSRSIDRYEVIDITGKVIDTEIVLNQNEITIVLRNYSAGMYVLKAYSGSDFST